MTDLDLIILVVYVISVSYILYQAIDSLDDQTVIEFDQESFNRQLEEKNLQDLINVKFKFEDRYAFDQPQELSISIENKADDASIRVDWDRSSITDYNGRSRRVIRLTPDRRLELFQPQVSSVIAPGKTLKEKLTAEDLLKRNAEKDMLESSAPLINIEELEKSAKSKKATAQQKAMYGDFMDEKAPLQFSLRLALLIISSATEVGNEQFQTLTCNFSMRKVPWSDALPFNPKK